MHKDWILSSHKLLQLRRVVSIFVVFTLLILLIPNVFAIVGGDPFPSQPANGPSIGTGERFSSNSAGSYASYNVQYTQPYSRFQSGRPGLNTQYQYYWPKVLNDSSCRDGGQDFLIQISPLGCTPAVIRSDLLEEQNVPVFCQLNALKMNPLIDVNAIDYLSFSPSSGKYPEGLQAVGYHPARAALKGNNVLINSPILNNIGYVVLVLKQNPSEKTMPDSVSGILTATIKYDFNNAFGIGKHEFLLTESDDATWKQSYKESAFWKGNFFLRAEQIDASDNSAEIGIYRDVDGKLSSFTLKKGVSREVPVPGYQCRANLQVRLDDLKGADTSATLLIDGERFDFVKGQRFL